jgi:hypothetical protein
VPRSLDGDGQRALVPGAGTELAARLDLASLGDVAAQARGVLVVDLADLVDTESADLAPPAKAATATPPRSPSAAARTARATPATRTAPAARTVAPAGTLALCTAPETRPRRVAVWAASAVPLTPLPRFVIAHVVLVLPVLLNCIYSSVHRQNEGVILSLQAKNLVSIRSTLP